MAARYTLMVRIGRRQHGIAYFIIRRSLQRRLRALGMLAAAGTRDHDHIQLDSYANEVCMECMEADLRVARDLLRIQRGRGMKAREREEERRCRERTEGAVRDGLAGMIDHEWLERTAT